MGKITIDDVTRCMSAYIPLDHPASYEYAALANFERLWDPSHKTMLDVGGGAGVMAQTIKTLFGLDQVASVDVVDRFLPSLDIETATYDGVKLPFPDNSFNCILFFNVLHHVSVASRTALMRECRRVAGKGPIYIKDHLSQGTIDDARLVALDLKGNFPHAMVKAHYLRDEDWCQLAHAAGYNSSERLFGTYRTGAFATLFPNRLEVSMRWRPT